MNFFKLYIGDYQRDTAHLSVTEHGAFLLMLQHYYATEKPLPVGKSLHRMLRAQDRAEREAIDAVAAQFWRATDAGLVNDRADAEITKANAQAETNRTIAVAREAARKAARHEHDSCSVRSTNDQPNQTPDTRQEQKKEARTKEIVELAARFDQFWLAYPSKVGKKPALRIWKSKRLDAIADQIVSDVNARIAGDRRWLDGYIPNPATYLGQERWMDETTQAPSADDWRKVAI